MKKVALLVLLIYPVLSCLGQDTPKTEIPRPTPLTRPLLKQWLESVKERTPRIPLPELTDEDLRVLGEQADSYEARVRHHYLNGIETPRPVSTNAATIPGRSTRDQDPKNSLDYAFKVELFWIVSRVNNCQYCIGHQESKLLGAGRSEDQIASLDGDWSDQSLERVAAFRFARRFTYEPQRLGDQDIRELKQYYSDLQILEMILSMCGNNSINRWKEGIAVPQRKDEGGYSRMATLGSTEAPDPKLPRGSYLTPTSSHYVNLISSVVPNAKLSLNSAGLGETSESRPTLETRSAVLEQWNQCRTRRARLPLISLEETQQAIPKSKDSAFEGENWVRLLANFPTVGSSRFEGFVAAETAGDLSPKLKGQIAWIVARHDRAWYAAARAMSQLRSLGVSDDEVFSLDGDWESFSEREKALFRVAKKLGSSPVVLTDEDVAEAVSQAGARDTVQAISYVCSRASFNRMTEAAGLPLE